MKWLVSAGNRCQQLLSWGRPVGKVPAEGASVWCRMVGCELFFGGLWAAIACAALGGALVAYGLESWGKFPACRLCHFQRLALALAGLSCALFAVSGSVWIFSLATLAWACLFGLSFYHVGVQFHLWSMPEFCQISWASNLDTFMAQPSARCDQRTLEIFGVPASIWLLLGSAVILVLAGWTWWLRPWRRA